MPRFVALAFLAWAWGAVAAERPFTESVVPGAGEVLCGDLDGDGLKDLLLLDGTRVTVFYQDSRNGFGREPPRRHPLGDQPALAWLAPLGQVADSLLVMRAGGVARWDLRNRTGPPAVQQLLAQTTAVPATLDKPAILHYPLSLATLEGPPLLLVPVAGALEVWRLGQTWQRVLTLEHALGLRRWALSDETGYRERLRVDLVIADLNGDRREDLVLRKDCGEQRLYAVHLQDREGTLSATPTLTYTEPPDWRSWLWWGDLDRDGHLDLIRSTWLDEPWLLPGLRSGKVLVQLYLADAQGRIPPEPHQVFRKNDWMAETPVVDVDGDGFLDLALGFNAFDSREGFRRSLIAKQLEFNLRFHLFTPGAGYAAAPTCQKDLLVCLDYHAVHLDFLRGHYEHALVDLTGDFDGDGDKDLLVRDRADGFSVYGFRSRATGFSLRPDLRFPCPEPVARVRVEDLNGDRVSDLVLKLASREAFRIFVSRSRGAAGP